MHPDLLEFWRYFPPRVIVTNARCPRCRAWMFVDGLKGIGQCASLDCGAKWTLRQLIDWQAARLMRERPKER